MLDDFFLLKSERRPIHPLVLVTRANERLVQKRISTAATGIEQSALQYGYIDKINWTLNIMTLFEIVERCFSPTVIVGVIMFASVCKVWLLRVGFEHPLYYVVFDEWAGADYTDELNPSIRSLILYGTTSFFSLLNTLRRVGLIERWSYIYPDLTLASQIVSIKQSLYYLVIIIYLFNSAGSAVDDNPYLYAGFMVQYVSYVFIFFIICVIAVVNFGAFLMAIYMTISLSVTWWILRSAWSAWFTVFALQDIDRYSSTCTDSEVVALYWSHVALAVASAMCCFNYLMLWFNRYRWMVPEADEVTREVTTKAVFIDGRQRTYSLMAEEPSLQIQYDEDQEDSDSFDGPDAGAVTELVTDDGAQDESVRAESTVPSEVQTADVHDIDGASLAGVILQDDPDSRGMQRSDSREDGQYALSGGRPSMFRSCFLQWVKVAFILMYVVSACTSILTLCFWDDCSAAVVPFIERGIVYFYTIWGVSNIIIPWIVVWLEKEQMEETRKRTG